MAIPPKKKSEKWVQFAAILTDAVGDILGNDENDNHIELKEEDLTDFFHALANAMPTMVYNNITGAGTDQLGFNHIANRLCVQFRSEDGNKEQLDQFDNRVDHTQTGEE